MKLSELLQVKKLSVDEVGKRLINECAWTVSAKGPNGATIRTELAKGSDDQAAAKAVVVAASIVATKDTPNGLTVRRSLASKDKQHNASRSAALAGMSAESHVSIVEGFADALGVEDDETVKKCAENIKARLGDLAPANTINQGLPTNIASNRKQVAQTLLDRSSCNDSDRAKLQDMINLTSWSDESEGDVTIAAIRDGQAVELEV